MNTAVRIAIAAAFGVATVTPAFAQLDVKEAAADKGKPEIAQNQVSPTQTQYSSSSNMGDRYYRGNLDWSMAGSSNELGSPAGDMATDREIRLGKGGNVGVFHGETVKFITAGGREFRWRFDTLKPTTSFPLASSLSIEA